MGNTLRRQDARVGGVFGVYHDCQGVPDGWRGAAYGSQVPSEHSDAHHHDAVDCSDQGFKALQLRRRKRQ